MPVFALAPAAATAFWGATGAGIAAGAGLAGAKISANASRDAANAQVQAARDAQAAQTKANEDALAFQKQQAAEDLARANALQQGNYNQWASREGRLSDFGSMLGLAPRNIPAYVPLTANGQAPPSIAAASAGGGSQAWTADFIKQQLQATGQDPSEQNVQYWLGKEGELKAREQQLNQPGYALWRLRDPNSGKSGAAQPSSYANSFASMPSSSAPVNPLVLTPQLNRNSFAQFVN